MESCITDSQPLVTGLCVKGELTSAKVINITMNPNCLYLLNMSDISISALGNLSKETITESNGADIAKELANLTSPGNDLDANDVIFTSMIMTGLSNLESIDEEVVNSTFETVVSNIMTLPDSELQKSQSLSSSKTGEAFTTDKNQKNKQVKHLPLTKIKRTNRIIQALEQIATRANVTDNTLKISEKNLSLVIADNRAGYETILGIQLENIGNSTKESASVDVLTANKTIEPETTDDVKGQSGLYDISHRRALSVITVIGLSLSITGLGLTLVSFMLFKHLRNDRAQKTLLNLVLALLCSLVVFVAGIDQTESYGGCIVVAVMMHYFLLVTFMWMFVEGFLQYLHFVRVLDTYIPKFMLKASIVAWGAPSIPVIIVLAVDYDLYKGGSYYCWMSRQPFYYAFLLPIAIIVLGNSIVFALVLKHLMVRPKGFRSNQSEKKRMIMNIRASISIFVLLGLTWVFGILAIEDARLVFSYIFTILTTLQGFFIFVLFVARNKQFRNSWKNFFMKREQFRYCWELCFSSDEKTLRSSTVSTTSRTQKASSLSTSSPIDVS